MYLADTNVLSVGAPGRRERSGELIDWMDARSDELFVSTVTIAEASNGIARLKRTGGSARAARIADWLELVLHLYSNRVIPFDIAAARRAGLLMDKARAMGHSPGFADLAIAATAASRDLTVLTRNLKHFVPLGVQAADPFEKLPA